MMARSEQQRWALPPGSRGRAGGDFGFPGVECRGHLVVVKDGQVYLSGHFLKRCFQRLFSDHIAATWMKGDLVSLGILRSS